MLLSLTVSNFKSITDAVVRLGPLTCFVGHNGVGKSNLFDAIQFMSRLAEVSIHDAAQDVRTTVDGSTSPLDLIYDRDPQRSIRLAADMIAPLSVVDDFGRNATASTTLLRYDVGLRYSADEDRLIVDRETLSHHKLGDFTSLVGFDASHDFRASVAQGSRRGGPLISTDESRGAIQLHGDGGSRGRPLPVATSPLTVVAGTNTADYPTVLAAKREMASWKLLHLEPSAMRTPDLRSARPHVTASGGHLAATLRTILARGDQDARQQLVNRLQELNADVRDLEVYEDKVRDQLALRARIEGADSWLFSRSLSDGTLRYVALAIMLMDVEERGLLALEEPENGIHPSRVPELVELLYDYAVEPSMAIGAGNPLRQVAVNSHSPEVARRLRLEDLVFVERARRAEQPSATVFRPVEGTWRVAGMAETLPPKDKQSVADFIGGAPLRDDLAAQMSFDFGTAS